MLRFPYNHVHITQHCTFWVKYKSDNGPRNYWSNIEDNRIPYLRLIFNCNNLFGKNWIITVPIETNLTKFWVFLSINWHLVWHVDCMRIENIWRWKKERNRGRVKVYLLHVSCRTLTHSSEGSAACPIQKPGRSDSNYEKLPRRVIFTGKWFSVHSTAPYVTYFW